ncbi:MAG: amino acid ABC transporter permease [Lachnospiraceae bacterium]|nr:amino acid ABC transporter permease [Lachnospiraceae bacterium]
MSESIRIVMQYYPLFLKGLGYTLLVSVEAIIIALCIGTLLTVLRMGGTSLPNRIIRKIVAVYISFVRGTPILVQIYLIFQALSVIGLNLSAFVSGVIALSLNSGGFMAEIMRGGFSAIPKGQIEAAEAIGMSKAKLWTRIILPQVFQIVAPQLTSEFINVIKVSPMLSVLAVVELTRTAERLVKMTGTAIPFYIAIAIIYFIICALLEELVKLQERKRIV